MNYREAFTAIIAALQRNEWPDTAIAQEGYDHLVNYRRTFPPKPGVYCERHHLQMKAHGGPDDDWNMLTLPYDEHIMIHTFLYVKSNGGLKEWRGLNACLMYSKFDKLTPEMIKHLTTVRIERNRTASKMMSGKNSPNYGRKATPEQRKKLSERCVWKGKKVNPILHEAIVRTNRTRVLSPETIQRMSDAQEKLPTAIYDLYGKLIEVLPSRIDIETKYHLHDWLVEQCIFGKILRVSKYMVRDAVNGHPDRIDPYCKDKICIFHNDKLLDVMTTSDAAKIFDCTQTMIDHAIFKSNGNYKGYLIKIPFSRINKEPTVCYTSS